MIAQKDSIMTNILEFKKKVVEPTASFELFNMSVYQDAEGMYEVYMEIDESTDNWEVYIAMENAVAKFALDHGYLEFEVEDEDG